jgi:hypothetical protein
MEPLAHGAAAAWHRWATLWAALAEAVVPGRRGAEVASARPVRAQSLVAAGPARAPRGTPAATQAPSVRTPGRPPALLPQRTACRLRCRGRPARETPEARSAPRREAVAEARAGSSVDPRPAGWPSRTAAAGVRCSLRRGVAGAHRASIEGGHSRRAAFSQARRRRLGPIHPCRPCGCLLLVGVRRPTSHTPER